MVQFNYEIKDPAGIHPRPAGLLINQARKFKSDFFISVGDRSCDMLKLLSLVGLSVRQGDLVTVSVSGEDEDAASDAIMKYFTENL
ncbi:MAG: HPr family phosphocarrier protein [Eubacterium sp.]|nr:HPr family phosphocarrier protein [Eubacterium sp.]